MPGPLARFHADGGPQPWDLDFANASSTQLKLRIRSMLNDTRKIPLWSMGLRAGLGILLMAGFVGLAPSLSVVLSYKQNRAAQPTKPTSLPEPIKLQPHEGFHRKSRTFARRLPRWETHASQAENPAIPAAVPAQALAAPTPLRASNTARSNVSGPTLKRRGDGVAPGASRTSTTIQLSGESPTYSGGPDAQHRTLDSIFTTASNIGAITRSDKDNH